MSEHSKKKKRSKGVWGTVIHCTNASLGRRRKARLLAALTLLLALAGLTTVSWHTSLTTRVVGGRSAPNLSIAPMPKPRPRPRPRKPSFYLLVGLPKTGTSFLQSCLSENLNFTNPLLLKDNLVYIGTTPTSEEIPGLVTFGARSIIGCRCVRLGGRTMIDLATTGSIPETIKGFYPFHQAFIKRIKQLRKTKLNPILIYEVASFFSDRMIRQLKAVLTSHWNVKILITHRFFHQWLLSWHNQDTKLKNQTAPEFRKHGIVPFQMQHNLALSNLLFSALEKQSAPLHPAILVKRMWQKHFKDVQLIKLNQLLSLQAPGSKGDALLEYFFCTVVANNVSSSNTCQQARKGMINSRTKNSYRELGYDLIAQAAHRQGLVPRKANRFEVARHIQLNLQRWNLTIKDLPSNCLSETDLLRLERISALVDRSAISDWTEATSSAHHASFMDMVQQRLFCSVNALAVMRNGTWRQFFRSLGPIIMADDKRQAVTA